MINLCRIIVFFMILVLISGEARSQNQDVVPLCWKDLYMVSEKVEIPFGIMVLLLHHEGGAIGMKKKNANGTFDYGPYQINSIHLKSEEFIKAGITADQLQYNGRVNAVAAAYYLRKVGVSKYMDRIMDTVARYHSFTPEHKDKYKKDFLRRMQSYKNVASTIERANRRSPNEN